MKITINKNEEIELTERECKIFKAGQKDGLFGGLCYALISAFIIFFFCFVIR